ncbi:hypothetical protein K458DRAFT_407835 [Lentithecium fluviatile CBS 122367]|uniref:Uncharacterized protein n=1 Tax=Lentithecium fluviatile CBS 122367 TaxID=1168545 RepID=A0A6G1INA6_9PLEO|nr:hypothetical protein K458DRAFT_407835 [Lentithecium fluviatile CBS 122367]
MSENSSSRNSPRRIPRKSLLKKVSGFFHKSSKSDGTSLHCHGDCSCRTDIETLKKDVNALQDTVNGTKEDVEEGGVGSGSRDRVEAARSEENLFKGRPRPGNIFYKEKSGARDRPRAGRSDTTHQSDEMVGNVMDRLKLSKKIIEEYRLDNATSSGVPREHTMGSYPAYAGSANQGLGNEMESLSSPSGPLSVNRASGTENRDGGNQVRRGVSSEHLDVLVV